MTKADRALVEELVAAAHAAIADAEVRARIEPEAVDDVDEGHLRLRIDLFRKMPGLQRMLLRAHGAKVAKAPALPRTPDRDARIASLAAAARRACVDGAAVEDLLAVADRFDDDGLDKLVADLDRFAKAQRMDIDVLLDMDRRAELREARAAERAEASAARASASSARKEKLEQLKRDLEAKLAELEARQVARRSG